MKIADDDKLYELLDQWHEDDEYDKILNTIFEIPREQWSIDLWFRVISAYNNKEDFNHAIDELEQIKPFCTQSADISRWHNMYGYIFYYRDQYVMAKWFFDKAIELHPINNGFLPLRQECQEYIDQKVSKIQTLIEHAEKMLSDIQKDLQEKDAIKDCEGVEFWALLSFPAAFRVVPGLPHCMGTKTFFKCPTDEEKKELKEFLASQLAITDTESTMNALSSFHSGSEYMDFVSFWNGKGFDVTQLDTLSRSTFESCMFFGNVIKDHVPATGIFATDITEMMMLLRMAYACDILSNYDYSKTALELADIANKYYHSWQEYAMATFCGSAYAVYRSTFSNLDETINFMTRQIALMPHLDYLYYNWEE